MPRFSLFGTLGLEKVAPQECQALHAVLALSILQNPCSLTPRAGFGNGPSGAGLLSKPVGGPENEKLC